MAKIDKLVPKQILWTVSRGRLGNTTLRTVRVHEVRIIEVNTTEGYVIASWNSNRAEKYYQGDVSAWRTKKPVTIEGFFGSKRLATREELKAMKANSPSTRANDQ